MAAFLLTAAMLSGNLTQAMSVTAFAAEDGVAFDVQGETAVIEEGVTLEEEQDAGASTDESTTEVSADGENTDTQEATTDGENEDTETDVDLPIDVVDPLEGTEEITVIEDEETPLAASAPMPAFSASGETSEMSVTASAPEGAFPEGTEMKVSAASASQVKRLADSALGDRYEAVDAIAVDITFYYEGEEIQPANGKKVNVDLHAKRAIAGNTHKAVHVDGNSADILGSAGSTDASVSAGSFSVYGIVGATYVYDVTQYVRHTYIFKVNGKEVDRQIVRNGDTLEEPEAPKDEAFDGWKVEGASTNLDFSQKVSISDAETTDRDVTVNAVFAKVYYATFYKDEAKSSVLKTKKGKKGDEITTADVTWQYADGKAIVGWKNEATGEQVDKVTFDDADINLIPIASEGVVQVTFKTGEGTPINPVFVEKGKKLAKPADPTRSGYAFTGWFTDEAGTEAYDFDAAVNDALTLYAGWEGEETGYKVVHWKQNANDENYTFTEMEELKGKAGKTASYKAKSYQGFELNTEKSDKVVTIKGDGTTIKNVYYDRKMYPLTFYVKENVQRTTTETYNDGYQSRDNAERDLKRLNKTHYPNARIESYQTGGWFSSTRYKIVYDKTIIETQWVAKETKEFKFEQDTSEFWAEVQAKYPNYNWYTTQGGSTIWADAKPMQLDGISGYGNTGSGSTTIYYLDESNNKELRTRYTFAEFAGFSADYIPPVIPGFTYVRREDPTWNTDGWGTITSMKTPGKVFYRRNQYKLQFVTNGGPAVSSVSGIPYEASLSGHAPSSYEVGVTTKTVDGIVKTFAGWYTDETLQQPFYFDGTMPALEVTINANRPGDKATLVLYAGWTSGKHTVSFNLDGGTIDGGTEIEAQSVESGEQAEPVGEPVKDGFVFGGWQDEDGNRFSFDTRIVRDMELTAIWNSDNSTILTVRYDDGDGTSTVTDTTQYHDGALAVIKGQPDTVPEGKYFKGWKIGSSNLVIAGGSFEVKRTDANDEKVVVLTAQYLVRPTRTTSVKYNANGGKFSDESDTKTITNAVVNGNHTIIEDVPVRAGYDFLGWSTNASDTKAMFTKGMTVAAGQGNPEDNILYAIWSRQTGTIKVTKKVVFDGEAPANYEGTFSFTITANSNTAGTAPETQTVTVNTSKDAITNDISGTAAPVTMYLDENGYRITENTDGTGIDGYTLATTYKVNGEDYSPDNNGVFQLNDNKEAAIVVTNTYTKDKPTEGTLTIKKTVTGVSDEAVDNGLTYRFNILDSEGEELNEEPLEVTVTVNSTSTPVAGTAATEISGTKDFTIEGVERSKEYTIVELTNEKDMPAVEGYDFSKDGSKTEVGKITFAEDADGKLVASEPAEFTNVYEEKTDKVYFYVLLPGKAKPDDSSGQAHQNYYPTKTTDAAYHAWEGSALSPDAGLGGKDSRGNIWGAEYVKKYIKEAPKNAITFYLESTYGTGFSYDSVEWYVYKDANDTCGWHIDGFVQGVEVPVVYHSNYYPDQTTATDKFTVKTGETHTVVDYSETRLTDRTGYTFKGWAESASATTAKYNAGEKTGTIMSRLDLYAVWEEVPKLTLTTEGGTWTYDGNGHSAELVKVTASDNSVISDEETTITFTIWNTDDEGNRTTMYQSERSVSLKEFKTAALVSNPMLRPYRNAPGTFLVEAVASRSGYTTSEKSEYKLIVNKRPLKITVGEYTKQYGESDPEYNKYTVEGLLSAHTISFAEGAFSREAGEEVKDGGYTVNLAKEKVIIKSSGGSLRTSYYDITIIPGKLTITKATDKMTITAKDGGGVYDGTTRYYGDVTVNGLTDAEKADLHMVYKYATSEAKLVSATEHDVKWSDWNKMGTLNRQPYRLSSGTFYVTVTATHKNYTDVTAEYKIVVTKRPIKVTVADASKTYGDPDPTVFTYKVEEENGDRGLVSKHSINKDDVKATRTKKTDGDYAANWLGTEAAGTYDITVDKSKFVIKGYYNKNDDAILTDNYEIEIEKGTFTINKKDLTITINNATVPLSALASYTPTYTTEGEVGNVDGSGKEDTVQNEALTFSINDGIAITSAGSYAVTATYDATKIAEVVRRNPYVGASYNITIIPGTLTVTVPGGGGGDTPGGGDDTTGGGGGDTPATPPAAAGDTAAVLGARRDGDISLMAGTDELPDVLGARRGVRTGDDSMMLVYLFVLLAVLSLYAHRVSTGRAMRRNRKR